MSSLRIDRHGHVTVFTLDRPEKRNAYDDATMDEMGDAFVAFDADPEQYVGIVTGAGDAFCSGNDLSSPRGGRIRTGPRRLALTDMFGVGATTKPVIAAVNGLAVAGGCEIALACDFRIAADTAWFGLFEPKRGLVPGAAIQLLPRMLNYGDASWMLLTAARVDADEALRIGLVQKVVPAATLMDVALETAQGMCELSQVSLQMIKQTLRHHRDLALKESLEYGAVLSRLLNLGADVDEGIAAFREKRDTHFGNRWPDAP
ncbi:MAG TPA: enoyl-CoA hydratase-related protein [Acidimicrobiia bacterium]|nr:enoyl-CoA hydratase-related protein [Acidimicrobiia bacterium]